MMNFLAEGTKVKIHNLGPNITGEYRAYIRGIVSSFPMGCVYIVELVDKYNPTYAYSHSAIPSNSVRAEDW